MDQYDGFFDFLKPKTTAPTTTTATYDFLPLKRGVKASQVGELQSMLNERSAAVGAIHPHLTVDGDYGTKTETAVKNYQRAAGLSATGIVYKDTWESLRGITSGTTAAAGKAGAGVSATDVLSWVDSLLPKKDTTTPTTFQPSTPQTPTTSWTSMAPGIALVGVVVVGGGLLIWGLTRPSGAK